ncbi:MAG: class II aldolase/adducin family protein [Gammaproteobacteria bacterium]|nr:class II aldolase/adducin family protein [Gammaproteobacteria bacterium]
MSATESHWDLREKIIELCLWMNSSGLNQGTSGNISARYKNSMLITPSGVPYEQLKRGDIAKMSLKHNRYEWEGPYAPSSEWHFHRAILQSNPDFKAIVHTHSTYATVLSMACKTIPACHYMIGAFGGNTVRCSNYATFGTPELSTNILTAMQDRTACLMENHGMVVAGPNLDKAMWGAVELETLSKQYYLASKLEDMKVLPDDEMDRVIAKFANYGPRDKNSGAGKTNGQGHGNSDDSPGLQNDKSHSSGANGDQQQNQPGDSVHPNSPIKNIPNIKLPTTGSGS